MAIASSWLTIDDDELKLQLSLDVLMQVEADMAEFASRDRTAIIYKLDSELLLPVLASGFGISKAFNAKGAIAVWTYYDQISTTVPIVRTLLTLDGDLSQKVNQQFLQSPIAERIISVHSFLIGQISQQIVTVITEYIYLRLQPYVIGFSTYVATRLYFCDPIRAIIAKLADSLSMPNELQTALQTATNHFTDCNILAVSLTAIALLIWWLVSKSPLAFLRQSFQSPNSKEGQISSMGQSFIKSLNQLCFRIFNKSLNQLGADFLKLLDSRWAKILAIALLLVLGVSWLLESQGMLLSTQQRTSVHKLASSLEPFLPLAIISVRQKIISWLGNIFFGNPLSSKLFIKLFFGRFLTMR
jgi:hypothetical protein